MSRHSKAAAPPEVALSPATFAWSLLAITAVAAALRLWDLTHAPPGLNQDEAIGSWISWCLLKTGHDMTGQSWPVFYSHGIGDYPSTLFLYLAMPFQALGGLNVWTARLPSAVSGVLCIPLVAYVGTRLFGRGAALVAAALLALNPWHLFLSRFGTGASHCSLFALLAVALLLAARLPLSDRVERHSASGVRDARWPVRRHRVLRLSTASHLLPVAVRVAGGDSRAAVGGDAPHARRRNRGAGVRARVRGAVRSARGGARRRSADRAPLGDDAALGSGRHAAPDPRDWSRPATRRTSHRTFYSCAATGSSDVNPLRVGAFPWVVLPFLLVRGVVRTEPVPRQRFRAHARGSGAGLPGRRSRQPIPERSFPTQRCRRRRAGAARRVRRGRAVGIGGSARASLAPAGGRGRGADRDPRARSRPGTLFP